MGVSYSAIVGIGKEFDDKHDAEAFLEKHNVLSDEDRERIEEDGLSEWLYDNEKVEGRMLDCYRGDYFFVGYELNCSNPEAFKASFDNGMELWKEYFKDVEPDMIKTVRVS